MSHGPAQVVYHGSRIIMPEYRAQIAHARLRAGMPLDRHGIARALTQPAPADPELERAIARLTRRRRTTFVPPSTDLAVPRGTQHSQVARGLRTIVRRTLARGLDVYDRDEDGHVADAEKRGVRA